MKILRKALVENEENVHCEKQIPLQLLNLYKTFSKKETLLLKWLSGHVIHDVNLLTIFGNE